MKKELEYINESIENLQIESDKKSVLRGRFLFLIETYKSKLVVYKISYDFGRFFVIIGSISIPALLSIENYINRTTSFWLIWSISLMVSLINGYITLFKLDKKYYSHITITEKLACEFWQYMCLCGKYSGSYGHSSPTHENQFVFFTNNIERIQIKNIEEIYIKMLDSSAIKQPEEKNPVPSISEETYNKSSELKENIQELTKVVQLKNVVIT